MKVAIITDLHSNVPALEAVLKDIKDQNIQDIYCLGDIANPLPQTYDVYQMLIKRNIPIIRGNHEDYLIDYFFARKLDWSIWQRRPLKLVAESVGKKTIEKFREFPFSMKIKLKNKIVNLVHASPLDNQYSFLDGFNDDYNKYLDQCDEDIIVSGHRHKSKIQNYKNKIFVSVGSLGQPHIGPKPEYALLSDEGDEVSIEFKNVTYDYFEVLRDFKRCNFLELGAPFSWLVFEEFRTGAPNIGFYFHWAKKHGGAPKTKDALTESIIQFFKEKKNWEEAKEFIFSEHSF